MMETMVLPAQDHLAQERYRAMSGFAYPMDRVPRSSRRKGNVAPAIETTPLFMLRTRSGGDIPLNVGDVQKAVHKHTERIEKWTSTERKRPSDKKKTKQAGATVDSASHPSATPRTRSGGELPHGGHKNSRKKPPRDLEDIGQTPAHPMLVSADGQSKGTESVRAASSGQGSIALHKKVVKKKTSHEHPGRTSFKTRSPDGMSTDSDDSKSGKEEDAALQRGASAPGSLTTLGSESGLAPIPAKATVVDVVSTRLFSEGQVDSSITSLRGGVGRRVAPQGVPGRGRPLGRSGSLNTESERNASDKGRSSVSRSDSAGQVDLLGCTPTKGSERWAGPGFVNSPPPSTLPLPKFSFRLKSGVIGADLSMDHLTGADSTPVAYGSIVPLLATSDVLGNPVDPSSATKQLRKLLNLGEETEIVQAEAGKQDLTPPVLAKMLEEELQSIRSEEGSEELKSIAAVVYDDVKALIEVQGTCNKTNSVATWQLKKMLQL